MKRIKPSLSAKSTKAPPPAADSAPDTREPGEEQISLLPLQFVLPLLREMDEAAKRKMAQTLDFAFAKRNTRKWPEALFAKSMLDLAAQARGSRELRARLAAALLAELRPLLQAAGSDLTPEHFDEDPGSRVAKYGKWHSYWALYFQTGAESESVDRERLERLAASDAGSSPAPMGSEHEAKTNSAAAASETSEQRRIEKLNRRIEMLEQRCRAEEERARRADKEALDSRRDASRLREQTESLVRELEAEKRQNRRLAEEREETAGRLAELKRNYRQERSRTEEELADLRRKMKEAEHALEVRASRGESEEGFPARPAYGNGEPSVRTSPQPASSNAAAEAGSDEAEELFSRFGALLRQDMRFASAGMPGGSEAGDLEARTLLRRALDLLDAVDAYAAGRRLTGGIPAALPEAGAGVFPRGIETPQPQQKPNAETASSMEKSRSETFSMEEALEQVGSEAAPGLGGTFHRRDHGGYIVLETGETFNITESMVYKHRLQHEAEVWCTPREDGHGGTQYEIELLFQGDDAYSPVRQYNGYVELGEHEVWYAVDMNDADRRYPIHAKDLDIQRPADGAPCIFNVGEEETVARLARVYRDFSDPEAAPRRDPAAARQSVPASSKPKKEGRKSRPEPFLEGCTIVVLGGQRKWFEDVVVESGATYVHENGERPDLVASDLRRAQALFLLITSTSHRASWEGVELAKTSGVPYFIIQGSKSNLRSMLWENREEILHANRGDEKHE
ncbi:hypothetical protein [Saccharibacillus deserti]|uniref:hypothetical protein n=1 Tax=Saccharibacillus deserti TaxID=1634444 RepID=UPI00155741A8|nr:hypothetical protein [Saccharibacillus deserti]